MPVPTGLRLAWAAAPEPDARRAVAFGLLADLAPGARFVQRCPLCGGPHGPVRVAGAKLHASVTYAGGLAIVAAVPAGSAPLITAIGIDAEAEADPQRDAVGLRGILGEGPATLRGWTRVEAALKADGRGLRVEPSTVSVIEDGDGWRAGIPDAAPVRGWDLDGPAGVVLSGAVRLQAAPAAASGPPSR